MYEQISYLVIWQMDNDESTKTLTPIDCDKEDIKNASAEKKLKIINFTLESKIHPPKWPINILGIFRL